MKIRSRSHGEKIETQMAPMIDVVFQLLIFFMLTLKIIEPEGDFDINMPLGRPQESAVTNADLPPLKVRMLADPGTGQLTDLLYNGNSLGTGDRAFASLNLQVEQAFRSLEALGGGDENKQEIEIDPDFNLRHEYLIKAISACSGKVVDKKTVRFFGRIKFAAIRPEQ